MQRIFLNITLYFAEYPSLKQSGYLPDIGARFEKVAVFIYVMNVVKYKTGLQPDNTILCTQQIRI